jgi:hypothetical protein
MFLLEIIFEILIYSALKYPGAVVLWVLSGFSMSFAELLKIDNSVTGAVGAIALLLLGMLLF